MSAEPLGPFPTEDDELFAAPDDPIRRARVTTPEAYERVLAFWVAIYGIDVRWVRCDDALTGGLELHTYHRDGELIGTVAFRLATERELFRQRVPQSFPPSSDVIEISKLCISLAHRDGRLMRRVCEDVHARLVRSRRAHLAIAAPPWLKRQYAFIGFAPTGVRFPIPGVAGHDLEIMLSRQMRFGIYGMHTDPIRWNLFLARITDRLLAAGLVRHEGWQRTLVDGYRGFAPVARQLEKVIFRRAT